MLQVCFFTFRVQFWSRFMHLEWCCIVGITYRCGWSYYIGWLSLVAVGFHQQVQFFLDAHVVLLLGIEWTLSRFYLQTVGCKLLLPSGALTCASRSNLKSGDSLNLV